jgi:hypothetical protein
MTSNHPQRRRQSGPRVLRAPRSGRSAAQSLDGRRSGGYSRHQRPALCFQYVHAQQPPRYRQATTERQFFLLVADSIHVHPQQPVNTSVFAVAGCRPLIPLTFPPGNFKFLYSSRLGVTSPCYSGAEHSARSSEIFGGFNCIRCATDCPAKLMTMPRRSKAAHQETARTAHSDQMEDCFCCPTSEEERNDDPKNRSRVQRTKTPSVR